VSSLADFLPAIRDQLDQQSQAAGTSPKLGLTKIPGPILRQAEILGQAKNLWPKKFLWDFVCHLRGIAKLGRSQFL